MLGVRVFFRIDSLTETNEFDKFEQLVKRLESGSTLLRAWSLTGGVSAQVTALEIERADGETQKLVVRQHGEVDLRYNPNIAADEFRLLNIVHRAGLPAPKPYYVEDSGEIFATPCIVVEFVEGRPEFAPADVGDTVRQFAETLAAIHRVDVATADLSFLPSKTARMGEKLSARPAVLDESLEEGRIRDALEAVWPPPQANSSVLLHGDYWSGNLLWKDGRLAAVIDWEDAAVGDRLADLGKTRLEVLWTLGFEAMLDFTAQYRAFAGAIDTANLPYWDLCGALKAAHNLSLWTEDAESERRMRECHKFFVMQAFEKLNAES
jgi:aminoglycoside phosphotransferase (APT) family kinase protein